VPVVPVVPVVAVAVVPETTGTTGTTVAQTTGTTESSTEPSTPTPQSTVTSTAGTATFRCSSGLSNCCACGASGASSCSGSCSWSTFHPCFGCRWFQLIFIDFQFLAHLAFRPGELLSSLCQMMFLSFNSNMTGANSGAGNANPSGASDFTRFLVGFKLLNL
jgi:hypothetical protein